MLLFFILWIVVLLLTSLAIVMSCVKKKKAFKAKSSAKMSVKIDSKMDSKKLGLHTHSHHHHGSSKKRKISNTESKNHTLTILDPSLDTFSATDESDVKSRLTGQRTREKEALEETATVELKERLLQELEATKSKGPVALKQQTPSKHQKASPTQPSKSQMRGSVAPSTQNTPSKSQTVTTSNIGKTAVSLATTKSDKSTMLEESPKQIQVNKGAGVRSKTISVIVNNQQQEEENNQNINQEGEENVEENKGEEEATQSKTILSKMRKKIEQLKKPKNKGKKKNLMSIDDKTQ